MPRSSADATGKRPSRLVATRRLEVRQAVVRTCAARCMRATLARACSDGGLWAPWPLAVLLRLLLLLLLLHLLLPQEPLGD